jgi:beta-ureidopropionase / N-carbamoyl-L-amino-acid hydrolase
VPTLRVDGDHLVRDLEALAGIGARPGGGVSRVAFSPADAEGRDWVDGQMRGLGMGLTRDPAGNSIGRYEGTAAAAPPIGLGSHTDTVPEGGRYDGALGVLGALACVRALRAAGRRLRHPVEVINFTAEEATMAGGTLGSRAMAGLLDAATLRAAAWDGRPVAGHLEAAGIDPAAVLRAERAKGSLAAFLELHVEQGGTLEASGERVGLVQGIVGIRRYAVTFGGRANHAGTTPMPLRDDALVAAAPFVLAVRDLAIARGIVGTIGNLRVHPGAPNVIPGRVDVDLEIRALDDELLDAAERDITAAAGSRASVRRVSEKSPVVLDAALVRTLEQACHDLDLPCRRMSSGAGHDTMCIASMAPAAMVFVPSRGGISHSAEEFTDRESCIAGADVLLAALLRLDAAH